MVPHFLHSWIKLTLRLLSFNLNYELTDIVFVWDNKKNFLFVCDHGSNQSLNRFKILHSGFGRKIYTWSRRLVVCTPLGRLLGDIYFFKFHSFDLHILKPTFFKPPIIHKNPIPLKYELERFNCIVMVKNIMLNLLWKLGPQNPTKWIKKCVLLYRPKSSPKTTGLIIVFILLGNLYFRPKLMHQKIFEQFKKQIPVLANFVIGCSVYTVLVNLACVLHLEIRVQGAH